MYRELMVLRAAAVLIYSLGEAAEVVEVLFGQVLAPLIGLVCGSPGFYYVGAKQWPGLRTLRH